MQTAIGTQTQALLLALLLGMAAGLCYDVLRPLHRCCGTLEAFLGDLLFCTSAAAAAFAFAMGMGGGRAGVWEIMASLAGFLLYMLAFGESVRKILVIIRTTVRHIKNKLINILKIFVVSAKKLFQKLI